MALRFGSDRPAAAYYGSDVVEKMYLGSTLVYEPPSVPGQVTGLSVEARNDVTWLRVSYTLPEDDGGFKYKGRNSVVNHFYI